MRVFDFTLLSGYEFSGVDVAQGFRARLFAKNNVNAKFIFTELPTIRDMELYGSQKIKRGQIISAHLFMTGRLDMSLSVKKEALLENEKENYEYDNIDEDGKVIRLYNSGEKSVEILCDEDGFVINESLFKNGKKYLENYYTDSLSYTELYNWDNDSSDGLNPERRIFWNKQGQMVYEQCIYKDNVEYLFKNGEVIDNVAFVERFIKELNLCENDICIMDRAGYLDYIQPLFENKGKSKLIAVLHSDHFYKIYEDESSLYMNYEYYYWFKYSEAIDYFVVGTDEHKRSLEAFLKEYDCFVPHIAAIPPGAIPEGKLKSKNNRWQGSISTSTSQSQSAANVVPTPAPTPAPAVDNAPAPATTITPAATPLAAATPVAPAAPAAQNTPIQDAQVPLAVNEEDDNLQNIEDEDTPLAAGGTAKDGIKTWWWWIAAAVAAITGKGVYDNRRRKPAKSDDSEDNSDEK